MAGAPSPAAEPGVPASGAAHAGPLVAGAFGRLTRALALAGGALLLAAIAITVASVVGRYGFAQPIPGDYELVELTCAVAVFLFFPYTHAVNGNISALFFTSGLPVRYRRLLDLVHDIVFALIAVMLTWRLAAGFADKFATGDATILLAIPFWWAYGFAVASMALLAVVCLLRIAAGIRTLRS